MLNVRKVNEMIVEIYIGLLDKTWFTDYIDIPSVSEKTIDELIDEYVEANIDYENIVFWGLYNIPSAEEDE